MKHRLKIEERKAKSERLRAKSKVFFLYALCLMLYTFLLLSPCYAAQDEQKKNLPIEASAAVDRASIFIGDKIIYTITVKVQKDIEVEFPQILPENLADFTIKDFGSSQKGLFRKKSLKQWYVLATYASGEQAIPAVVIKYRAKGAATWQELNLNGVKIKVKSMLDGAPNQTDIRDIRKLPSKIWLYLLIGLGIILIIGAVFVSIFLKKNNEESKPPPVPAHIIAYEALAALEKKDYIRKGEAKAYYIELSDIARQYLENRFNIRAPEMTTEEFLIKVKEDSALSFEHKGLLRDFLVHCDLVKFAKYQPIEEEASLSFTSAKKLIDQTKLLTPDT